jgi:hypothetical protein
MIKNSPSEQSTLKAIALLALSKNPQQIMYELNHIDLSTAYELAIKHGVVGQLASNLNTPVSEQKSRAIVDFKKKIDSYYKHASAMTMFMDAEGLLVLRRLHAANIKVTVLKGFALANTLYNHPALRPRTDIDILIHPRDKEAIKGIFQSLGYYNPRGWEPKAIINQFSMKKPLSKGVNVLFDIHLKISNSKGIENILNYDELLTNADTSSLQNINLINQPYALIHATFHLLNHRAAGDLVKLIWLYDIYLIIEQLDEKMCLDLLELIKVKGLATLVLFTLRLTSQYFSSQKLSDWTAVINSAEVQATANSSFDYLLGENQGFSGFLLTLKLTAGLGNKLNVIKETVLPPPAEIYAKYGEHSGWPLSLLYLRRLLFGLIKSAKNR